MHEVKGVMSKNEKCAKKLKVWSNITYWHAYQLNNNNINKTVLNGKRSMNNLTFIKKLKLKVKRSVLNMCMS